MIGDMCSISIVWICQTWILFNVIQGTTMANSTCYTLPLWSGYEQRRLMKTFNICDEYVLQDIFFFASSSHVLAYQWLVIKHVTSNAFHLGIANINQINVQLKWLVEVFFGSFNNIYNEKKNTFEALKFNQLQMCSQIKISSFYFFWLALIVVFKLLSR